VVHGMEACQGGISISPAGQRVAVGQPRKSHSAPSIADFSRHSPHPPAAGEQAISSGRLAQSSTATQITTLRSRRFSVDSLSLSRTGYRFCGFGRAFLDLYRSGSVRAVIHPG
jgi:hypothetical protein